MVDYANGCPMCGLQHDNRLFISKMNVECAEKWLALPIKAKQVIVKRYIDARKGTLN